MFEHTLPLEAQLLVQVDGGLVIGPNLQISCCCPAPVQHIQAGMHQLVGDATTPISRVYGHVHEHPRWPQAGRQAARHQRCIAHDSAVLFPDVAALYAGDDFAQAAQQPQAGAEAAHRAHLAQHAAAFAVERIVEGDLYQVGYLADILMQAGGAQVRRCVR